MKVLIKALLLLIGFGFATFAQVNVSLPDTSGKYLTTINIPVYTSDLTGQNVTAYKFKVKFDGAILEAKGVDVTGTLSDKISWTVTPDLTDDNSIKVSADGIFALSGKGVLVYLTFDVIAQNGQTALTFDDFTFNNGIPVANTTDGSFKVDVTLTLNKAGDGDGKVYVNGTGVNIPYSAQFAFGETVELFADPDDSSDFTGWTGDIQTTANPVNVIMDADKSITANFALKQFTVSTSGNPTEGGTTTGDGVYNYGTQVTVNATPNEGYKFVNWTENNAVVSTAQQYSFVVTSNRNLVANFEKLKYTVVTSANPAQGGTTSGDGEYFYGENVTVVATPNNGYEFLNWTENNIVVSTSRQFIFTINGNRNLVANFRRIKYTVHTEPNPQNGGSTSGDGQYFQGETVTVTATPNFRFVFKNWTENNIIVSTSPQYTFTIESNRNLVANFEIKAFRVAANVIPANSGTVEGTGNYKYGETAVLKAKAAYGFKFVEWRENGNPVSTDTVLSFTVQSNRTFDAIFTERNFTLSCAALPTDGGVTSGCGIFKYMQNANLKAYANPGWKFVNWTASDGTVLSNQNEFNLTVTQNLTVTANFDEELYTLTCKANPPDAGFTSGCGIFKYGQSAHLKAIPNNNWKFDYWSDSTGDTVSVDSAFVYIIEGEEELIANFSTLTGIENLNYESGIPKQYFIDNNYPNPFNPSTIIKFGLPATSTVSLSIFDVTGRLIRKVLDSEQLPAGVYKFNFVADDLPSGIYFYRVVAFSGMNKNSFIETRKMILLK